MGDYVYLCLGLRLSSRFCPFSGKGCLVRYLFTRGGLLLFESKKVKILFAWEVFLHLLIFIALPALLSLLTYLPDFVFFRYSCPLSCWLFVFYRMQSRFPLTLSLALIPPFSSPRELSHSVRVVLYVLAYVIMNDNDCILCCCHQITLLCCMTQLQPSYIFPTSARHICPYPFFALRVILSSN